MASPEREPGQHPDPFENLRLDEGFVRAARFIEPSAVERGRPGDRRDPGRCQVMPANRGLAGGMHRIIWAPRPRRRRLARMVAFLAVLAGVISLVVALRHSNNRPTTPVASSPGAARASSAATAPVPVRTAGGVPVAPTPLSTLKPGDCVSLAPAGAEGSSAAVVVPCGASHQAEVIKLVQLGWRLPGAWPGMSPLDALAASECGAEFLRYTGNAGSDVPAVSGALVPNEAAWNAGVKVLACTAQRAQLAPITGQLGSLATPA
ncbi:septum formation family protein [Frankia nepalensis]|nr:septum formation family protein [Frankia nepalensis]